MLPLVLILLAQSADGSNSRVARVERVPDGRMPGGRAGGGAALAFFEAFNGRGTSTACSTTPPTGAKGEVLTSTRASSATCTKTATGGLVTTGIANGDLVVLTNDQPRAMYDSLGTLGLGVESLGINLLPRYDALGNASWSDVATPTLTGSQTDPFGGTTATSIDDNDGAAYEGRSQPVTVVALAASYGYCYVKAGTLDRARILLDGTAQTITGLSATTWSIIEVADASASGVAISFQVLNGNATSDTGTVIWGGCDVKAATYRTSIVPTAAAPATRVAELASFPLVPTSVVTGSMSARVWQPRAAVNGFLSATAAGAFKQAIITFSGERAYVGGVSLVGPLAALAAGQHSVGLWWDGSSTNLVLDGATTTGAAGTPAATDRLQIGNYDATAASLEDGIYSRIKYDPTTTRGL